MQDPIIKEVADEFGLTYQQGKELYEQYWMEYVAKNVGSHLWENVYVQGLGMFSARKANFEALLRDYNSGKIPHTPEKKRRVEQMIGYIEQSNSRRKNKKQYG